METVNARLKNYFYSTIHDSGFKRRIIIGIFFIITFHHYLDVLNVNWVVVPDLILGLTRHTIDRILYLIPIILSSFVYGSRGGLIAAAAAFAAMAPRAIFVSATPTTALLEAFVVTMVGSLVPLRIDYYERQGEKLEVVMDRLEQTERRLHSKVKMTMEQGKQLAVINTFSAILTQSIRLNQVLKSAINMVTELLHVEVVMIFLLDRQTKQLKINAFNGITQESAAALDGMKLGEGFCGHVAQSGKPLLIEDVTSNMQFCSLTILNEGLKTQLSVPLMARGNIMGTLCVATRTHRQFKEPEVAILSALGNLIGIAIDNFNLYRGREIAADKLKLSEQRFRQLFENAHDAIWVQDLNGKIVAANEAAAELFDCTLLELLGADSSQFLTQEELESSKLVQEKLLNKQSIQQPYTQRFIKKNGTEAILMLSTNLISTGSMPDGFQFIGRDITNELRMQENQSFYLKQVTKAHEDERQRISRDLHDSTAQGLIAVLHNLERLCKSAKNLPEHELQSLYSLHAQSKDLLQEVRQMSRDLRPSIIDDLGLMPAVEWLTEQLKKEHGIDVELIIAGDERRFAPEIEVTLFRIVQEALRNIAKHAEATQAQVAIDLEDKETRITISDNGKGFELPDSLGEFSRAGKLGVDGMQTRARLVGGTLDVQSEPGKGTTLVVTIPINGLNVRS